MIQYILIVVLAIALIVILLWLILIKKNIRELRQELLKTREEDYNRQIKVTLVDNEIEALAAEINKNLDYQKNLLLLRGIFRCLKKKT